MEKREDLLIDVFTGPFIFRKMDDRFKDKKVDVSLQEMLVFLCAANVEKDIDSVVKRYEEICQQPKKIFAVPMEENIIHKIVFPFRSIMSNYMMGTYIGVIGSCGFVSEMLAILFFEIEEEAIKEKLILNKEKIRNLQDFEESGQKERIRILKKYGVISDELKKEFEKVKNIRNEYLHYYSLKYDSISKDAKEIFNSVIKILRVPNSPPKSAKQPYKNPRIC